MKFRTIRICIRKGWCYIICSVSLLLLSIISNTAKASVIPSCPIQANTGDTISNKNVDVVADTINHPDTLSISGLTTKETNPGVKVEKINDSIADLISLIDVNVEEFASVYGPPSVIYKHRPIRRFFNWIKFKIRAL